VNGLRNSPKNFVVLVTDGMQFNWGNTSPGPIDPAACDAIKARGVTLAVIQLRYVPLHGDWAFDVYVRPHFDELGPALRQCASPDFFFSANTPAEIEEAFEHLSMRIVDTLRLTR
jgi:hypothetical protein